MGIGRGWQDTEPGLAKVMAELARDGREYNYVLYITCLIPKKSSRPCVLVRILEDWCG